MGVRKILDEGAMQRIHSCLEGISAYFPGVLEEMANSEVSTFGQACARRAQNPDEYCQAASDALMSTARRTESLLEGYVHTLRSREKKRNRQDVQLDGVTQVRWGSRGNTQITFMSKRTYRI